ncbi:MAG: GxxExxY protein [Candidatus Falkowbacteria bacterium]
MDDNKVLYKDLSYQIVGILFNVYNDLGYGYKEKYYEKGTEQYFINQSIKYVRRAPYQIVAGGKMIAMNYIDFVVDNKIVLELKKGNHFSKQNMDQIKQYLQITGLKLTILANFTPNGVKFIRVLNPNNLQK